MLRLAGQGLLGAGLGAAIGGASGAIGGAPSWVDHRITNGQPLQPETEEDWQQLKDTVGGYGQVGAWVGAGLGALAGLSAGRMAGSDEAVEAMRRASAPPPGAGQIDLPVSVPPGGGGGGGAGVTPNAFADDGVGIGVMRAMGRGLEDGRIDVNILRTVGMHKASGQAVADALGVLTPVEAASLAELGQRFAAGEFDKNYQEADIGIAKILYDQDSYRRAIDAMHAFPVGHNVNYVGNDRSWMDDFWTPDAPVLAQENLNAIMHDPRTSAEDKVAAFVGVGALSKAHGFSSPAFKARFYDAIGNEEKMKSYGDEIRNSSRIAGFDYDDWQQPSWIEGFDAEGEQRRWLEDMRRRGRQ